MTQESDNAITPPAFMPDVPRPTMTRSASPEYIAAARELAALRMAEHDRRRRAESRTFSLAWWRASDPLLGPRWSWYLLVGGVAYGGYRLVRYVMAKS